MAVIEIKPQELKTLIDQPFEESCEFIRQLREKQETTLTDIMLGIPVEVITPQEGEFKFLDPEEEKEYLDQIQGMVNRMDDIEEEDLVNMVAREYKGELDNKECQELTRQAYEQSQEWLNLDLIRNLMGIVDSYLFRKAYLKNKKAN